MGIVELVMSQYTNLVQGTPSWVELDVRDQEAAKRFYYEVFGWDFVDLHMGPAMMYSLALLDGAPVAAFYTSDMQDGLEYVTPHWNVYLSVDNIYHVAGRIIELGGNLLAGPFVVAQPGLICVAQDPTGAVVHFRQVNEESQTEIIQDVSVFSWVELLTPEPFTAGEFYFSLLGGGIEVVPTPDNSSYLMLTAGSLPVAGIIDLPPALIELGVPPHWQVYFRVDDAREVAARAKLNGADVLYGPEVVPDVGIIALIMDPQGAVFGIQEYQGSRSSATEISSAREEPILQEFSDPVAVFDNETTEPAHQTLGSYATESSDEAAVSGELDQGTTDRRGLGCGIAIVAVVVLAFLVFIIGGCEPRGDEGLNCTEQFERVNYPSRFSSHEVAKAARNRLTSSECSDIWRGLGW